jgi:cytoskeletal protein CcmA (bactofilin family)
MFGKKHGKTTPGNIDCLISAKTKVEGNIHFEGGLRVDGQIQGNLTGNASSTLIVSDQARLEGEVRASLAVINGTVKGSVHTTERLELQSKARITGDVHYRTLEMHPGAIVEGRLVHQGEEETVVPLKKNQAAAG